MNVKEISDLENKQNANGDKILTLVKDKLNLASINSFEDIIYSGLEGLSVENYSATTDGNITLVANKNLHIINIDKLLSGSITLVLNNINDKCCVLFTKTNNVAQRILFSYTGTLRTNRSVYVDSSFLKLDFKSGINQLWVSDF